MINSYAYDIEVLPNFFSFIFIDVKDYFKTFSDACVIDKKNKKTPIPLVQKYSVKEIVEKLNKVKAYSFYITDTDDSQLLKMAAFLNQLRTHKENDKIIYSHVFGYNSMRYDKLMIAGFLSYYMECNNSKELITKLYQLSQKIISTQDNYEIQKNDFLLKSMKSYKLPYTDIDVMRIFALNKVGKGINDKGETIYFGKSLKQTSINLQWYELLEHDLPPITEEDAHYYRTKKGYETFTLIQLNKLIDKWDRYIIPAWIPSTMHYNKNDVFIVCEMLRLYSDEINLRYNISTSYGINVLNSSRSNMADVLFEKFYSEFSGLEPFQWKGRHTDRTVMAFKRIILPFIKFKTPVLQQLLELMKKTAVTSLGKDSFQQVIRIGNLDYTVATGGLHSKDVPRELVSKLKYTDDDLPPSTGEEVWSALTDDSYVYVHYDISDAVSCKKSFELLETR